MCRYDKYNINLILNRTLRNIIDNVFNKFSVKLLNCLHTVFNLKCHFVNEKLKLIYLYK